MLIIRLATGWGVGGIYRTLRELREVHGFEELEIPSKNTINHWLYHGNVPNVRIPLLRALFDYSARELAVRLRREHPDWGHTGIATEIGRRLGVRVPELAVYFWITGRSRPNIMPIRACPELGYVVGVLMSDCARTDRTDMEAKDRDFVEAFRNALRAVTGKEYSKRGRYRRYGDEVDERYVVYLGGSPLKYLAKSRLYMVVEHVYPAEFIRGLFDGDGGVNVAAGKHFGVSIPVSSSDLRLLDFAQELVRRKFGMRPRREVACEEGEEVVVRRRCRTKRVDSVILEGRKDLEMLAERVGFSIERKRVELEDALEILKKYRSNEERVRTWRETYEKVKGRWVRKGREREESRGMGRYPCPEAGRDF